MGQILYFGTWNRGVRYRPPERIGAARMAHPQTGPRDFLRKYNFISPDSARLGGRSSQKAAPLRSPLPVSRSRRPFFSDSEEFQRQKTVLFNPTPVYILTAERAVSPARPAHPPNRPTKFETNPV
jgi:hypothetical protein